MPDRAFLAARVLIPFGEAFDPRDPAVFKNKPILELVRADIAGPAVDGHGRFAAFVQHLTDGISDGAMPLSHIMVSGAGLPRGRPGPAGRSRAVAVHPASVLCG